VLSSGITNQLGALGHSPIKTEDPLPQAIKMKIITLVSDSRNLITGSYQVKTAKLHLINTQRNSEISKKKQVRQ